MERYVCIHGHFYQPPRHHPWLAVIEQQDSAQPYHDWNERITAECYAPNTAARILDSSARIARIVNNYACMSFNFGPTLLDWLARHAPEVYAAILQADKISQQRYAGHGSALAQAYNHMILPLANHRDKQTQIRWGIEDFVHRFQRPPEGMWLPETAVDLETLECLAAADIRFTLLAPTQARRVRAPGHTTWEDVSSGQIDSTRPYLQRLPSGRQIALFFYHAPLARQVAFERLLNDGRQFAERLVEAFEPQTAAQLVHLATDGETYGHHHRFGEMALAYALHHIESHGLAQLTNYGAFLAKYPPTYEVEIQERTSWSCAHGVERWRSNCGCRTGGQPQWQQHWRAALRDALDWLRDTLSAFYEQQGSAVFQDPWAARDAYVTLLLQRSPEAMEQFLRQHGQRTGSPVTPSLPWRLLEMQHQAMLMYTSCGWFFDELSGLEPRQVLHHAARAIHLAYALGCNASLEEAFLTRLARAPSNLPLYRNGRHLYEHWIRPAIPRVEQLAVHFAMQSVAAEDALPTTIYTYSTEAEEVHRFRTPEAQLMLGRVRLTSPLQESDGLWFGVLHTGDHHFYGAARLVQATAQSHPCLQAAREAFTQTDYQAVIRLFHQHFPGTAWPLHALRPDAQRRILAALLASMAEAAEQRCRQLYETHLPLVHTLTRLRLPLPQALRSAAEHVLHADLQRLLAEVPLALPRLSTVLREGRRCGLTLDAATLQPACKQLLTRLAASLLVVPPSASDVQHLVETLRVLRTLPWQVDVWSVQNACYALLHTAYPVFNDRARQGEPQAQAWVQALRTLAEVTMVYVEPA